MVFVWACGRKGMALAGFGWACVWKGRALAGDHLPTRSGFNQGPSLVAHLGLVGTRIWAGFCDQRWVGRELRLSRPAFASSSRQGAAVERACTVKREAAVAGVASEGLALVSGSAGAGSSAVVVPT